MARSCVDFLSLPYQSRQGRLLDKTTAALPEGAVALFSFGARLYIIGGRSFNNSALAISVRWGDETVYLAYADGIDTRGGDIKLDLLPGIYDLVKVDPFGGVVQMNVIVKEGTQLIPRSGQPFVQIVYAFPAGLLTTEELEGYIMPLNVQADWSVVDPLSAAYVQNKPNFITIDDFNLILSNTIADQIETEVTTQLAPVIAEASAATPDVGTGPGTVAAGDDARLGVSLLMFGAASEQNAAYNTPKIQQALNFARDNGLPWHLPPGDYETNALVAYTSGRCDGVFVVENLASLGHVLTVAPKPEDTEILTGSGAADFANSLSISRGGDKLAALASYEGQVITLANYGDEVPLIRTSGNLRWIETFVVSDEDGSIYPPFSQSKTESWTAPYSVVTVTVIKDWIEIIGLKVRALDAVGTPGLSSLVRVTRPRTRLSGAVVENHGVEQILQGFVTEAVAHVTFDNCSASAMLDVATNYGFNLGGAEISLRDCSEKRCRRGVDVHSGKNVAIIGGSFPDGVGAHWGHGVKVRDAFISSDPSNTSPIHVAGSDVDVDNCNIKLRSDQYTVFNVRGDMSELRGRMSLRNCIIDMDCSDNLSTDRIIMSYAFAPAANTHNFGRKIWAPDLVEVSGNTIKQRGSSFTGKIFVANLFTGTALLNQVDGVGGYGAVNIYGNSWSLSAGLTTGNDQRLWVQIFKNTGVWIDGGYSVSIKDMPCLCFFGFAQTTIADPVTPRIDVETQNIGTLQWRCNFGLFKTARLGANSYTSKIGVGRPTGYTTPVGDELEVKTSPLIFIKTHNFGSIADGATSTITFTRSEVTVGDMVMCMMQSAAVGWFTSAVCLTDGVISLSIMNKTGETVDPPTSAFWFRVDRT